MRPHRSVQVTSLLFSATLAAAISQAPACSSGDTVLALTINSNQADVGAPANLRVTLTPTSGEPATETFTPDLVDGAILASFFRRFTLNGRTGEVNVTVDALDSSGNAYLSATTTADLVEHGAVAARVELKVAAPPSRTRERRLMMVVPAPAARAAAAPAAALAARVAAPAARVAAAPAAVPRQET